MSADVEPIPGELTRFYVKSGSKPDSRHLVDLSIDNGQGYCDCEAHAFICQRNRKLGKAPYSRGGPVLKGRKITYPDATICPHVLKVYEHLLPKLLRKLVAYNGRVLSGASSPSTIQTSKPAAMGRY